MYKYARLMMPLLINGAGRTVEANTTTLGAALNDFAGMLGSIEDQGHDRLTGSVVDSFALKAWPIAGYTYIVIRKNDHSARAAEVAQFIQFLLTDTLVRRRVVQLSFISFFFTMHTHHLHCRPAEQKRIVGFFDLWTWAGRARLWHVAQGISCKGGTGKQDDWSRQAR